MNNTTRKMVSAMFSAYPRSDEMSGEAYLAMIELGCRGIPDDALQQAVADVASGEHIDGRRKGWAPSADVFAAHARFIHDRNEIVRRARERMQIDAPKPSEAPIERRLKRLSAEQAAELETERKRVVARYAKEAG